MKIAACFSTKSIDCGAAAEKMTRSMQFSEVNPLLDAVVQRISPDHPDLNCDTVRMFQTVKLPYNWNARLGRRLLFYWQVWQWVMKGKLTTADADGFMDQELFQKAKN
jgi:hypothetical protein